MFHLQSPYLASLIVHGSSRPASHFVFWHYNDVCIGTRYDLFQGPSGCVEPVVTTSTALLVRSEKPRAPRGSSRQIKPAYDPTVRTFRSYLLEGCSTSTQGSARICNIALSGYVVRQQK